MILWLGRDSWSRLPWTKSSHILFIFFPLKCPRECKRWTWSGSEMHFFSMTTAFLFLVPGCVCCSHILDMYILLRPWTILHNLCRVASLSGNILVDSYKVILSTLSKNIFGPLQMDPCHLIRKYCWTLTKGSLSPCLCNDLRFVRGLKFSSLVLGTWLSKPLPRDFSFQVSHEGLDYLSLARGTHLVKSHMMDSTI